MVDRHTTTLGDRVERTTEGGAELWALALDVPEVVSFRASFLTGLDLGRADRTVQRAAVRLLDRGCERLDRFEIAEWLEGRGAHLQFFSSGRRAGFSGRCLRSDLLDVLALAAELLDTPRFEPDEVEKARRELEASLRQAASDTAYLSDAALSRVLYAAQHPAFIAPLERRRAEVDALTRETLVGFHAAHLKGGPLLLAVAGDLRGVAADALLRPFSVRPPRGASDRFPAAETEAAGRTDVPVSDKSNFDVRVGHGVRLLRSDADFQPLRVGVYALGGNFSSRLMQEVRDRQGLTYGIRASLEHVDVVHHGHFEIRAGFSPADLPRGLEATRAVLDAWQQEGVEPGEVERVKETLVGTYDVGLSTTQSLAATMLHRAEQGFSPAYLDRYRDEIDAVQAEGVNAAIVRHLQPAALHVVTSGPPA